MDLKLNIPVKGSKKYLIILNTLSFVQPYSQLNNREKEVLAELLYYNNSLSYITEEKRRNKLVFDYDTRLEIANKMGVKTHVVLNNISSLRKKGLLNENSFVSKYVIKDLTSLTFLFNVDGSE